MPLHEPDRSPPAKRRRVHVNSLDEEAATEHPTSKGLTRPISPPSSRRKSPAAAALSTPTWRFDGLPKKTTTSLPLATSVSPVQVQVLDHPQEERDGPNRTEFIASPFQLTRVEDMGPYQNVDTVGLKDLLGDPLIKECWNFNFLFDLDFVMQHFDSDVRDLVKVKIIHGFWKRDDERRITLLETAERYPNIELLSAYIPNPFGTHHSKMLILFRHDDTAQVIIHTANMIYRDWINMTQAVWASPMLSLSSTSTCPDTSENETLNSPIGSGERFKVDLLRYLAAYERRSTSLIQQLTAYDFSPIRAAFIGSAPSRQKPAAISPLSKTSFGWLGLQEILSKVPVQQPRSSSLPHVVIQISSIATLGPAPTWLTNFQSVLARHSTTQGVSISNFTKASTFFSQREPVRNKAVPKFSIIFPTPEEIRTSLDGYISGGSIHWKLQSVQQQKQLEYMHPLLCHWKVAPTSQSRSSKIPQAHRGSAAPHIKTYFRFSDEEHKTIDWAMVTSANLSKQAWGDLVNKKDEVWIQSWEAGVVVWPALFAERPEPDDVARSADVIMVPVFGKDLLGKADLRDDKQEDNAVRLAGTNKLPTTLVGIRMPYDLPLLPYGADEKPWCATMKYGEPDWKGLSWGGY